MIRKYIWYIWLAAAAVMLSLSGCVKDNGNYDYRTLTPIEIDIPEVMLTAGSYFSIPEVTVTGGSGHIDYSVQLLYNGAEVFADENGEVFLDAKGTFSFVVQATDYLGQEKTLQTNLTVNVPQEPVMDIPFVPSYAETGTKIIFPDFTATDYYTAQDCVKEIYVNGKLLDEDREYEVTEEAGSYLTVEYYAYSQREVAVRSFSVYVFDTESVIDYFMTGNNVERELSDRGIIFSSEFDFAVNVPFAVFADEFLFTLRPNTEANAFGYVDITLSDSVDPSVYVNLRITPNGTTASWLQIDGSEERYTLSGSLQYGESGITLMWDNESLCFRTSSGTRIAYVLNRADGKVFHGFESGKVNISISVGGVYGNASLIVYQIANQMFNSMSDIIRTGAQITYADAMYNRKVALYDTVTVPAAEASDPFCMDVSVTVSVSDPSGNIVLASSPADTHYSFRALEYGIYTITYVATSSRGSTTTERYSYTVTDYDPPVISVSGVPSSVKSGKSFSVPDATVTDNVSEECTLYIFVRGENLRYTPVTAGEKLSLDDGIYLLVYYAVDDAGNFTRREFEIVVG